MILITLQLKCTIYIRSGKKSYLYNNQYSYIWSWCMHSSYKFDTKLIIYSLWAFSTKTKIKIHKCCVVKNKIIQIYNLKPPTQWICDATQTILMLILISFFFFWLQKFALCGRHQPRLILLGTQSDMTESQWTVAITTTGPRASLCAPLRLCTLWRPQPGSPPQLIYRWLSGICS